MGGAGTLDHLDGFQHVAAGLGQHLAVFGGDQLGQLVEMGVEQLLEAEHQLNARRDRRVAPCRKGGRGGRHGAVHLLLRATGRLGDEAAGGRVHDRHVFAGLRHPPFVVDEIFSFSTVPS